MAAASVITSHVIGHTFLKREVVSCEVCVKCGVCGLVCVVLGLTLFLPLPLSLSHSELLWNIWTVATDQFRYFRGFAKYIYKTMLNVLKT